MGKTTAGPSLNFDWSIVSTLLDSSSPIPGDVKFKVVDNEDQVVATFEAHKFLLALHSSHFKNVFFGSGVFFKEEEENTLLIKETTKEAFGDFLGFYYEEKIDFKKKTLAELYEILNLAERYQVKELKREVNNYIENFPLSVNTVVKVASTSREFSHFEDVSQALYTSCVDYLATQFTDAQSVFAFINSSEDETTVMRLLKDASSACPNCRKNPCRNRSDISANEILVPGMMVETYGSGFRWREKYQRQLCKVVDFSEGNVSVSWVDPPMPADPDVSDPYSTQMGARKFIYVCDK